MTALPKGGKHGKNCFGENVKRNGEEMTAKAKKMKKGSKNSSERSVGTEEEGKKSLYRRHFSLFE